MASSAAEVYPQANAPLKATVMGVRIGQTPAALVRLDSITVRRNARSGEDQLSTQARKREDPPVRTGFGKGTLSIVGAAAQAVSSNLESAREITPSVEELRQEAEAAAQVQRKLAEQQQPAPAPENAAPNPSALERAVSARPKAEPLAKIFTQPEPSEAPQGTAPAPLPIEAAANAAPAEPVNSPKQDDGASALLNLLA